MMVPIIDLMNHSFNNNCKIVGEYSRMSDKSYCLVQATRDIQFGEELSINYGNFNNLELFSRFGFIEKQNPHDTLKIDLDEDK